MKRPATFVIFGGGGIAATLDIAYALTFWYFYRGVAPSAVLHTIAGGLLGLPAARAGGAATAALGLGLHFAIAFAMAAAFFVAARQFRFLTRQPIIAGIAYGIVLYAIMNFVVLPLSALPAHAWTLTPASLGDLCSHMFFVGMPIALATRRAIAAQKAAA